MKAYFSCSFTTCSQLTHDYYRLNSTHQYCRFDYEEVLLLITRSVLRATQPDFIQRRLSPYQLRQQEVQRIGRC